MDGILIAVIVVLCQYPIAVLTLMKMLRQNLQKTPMIIWNLVIISIPFLGAASYWIYYLIDNKRKAKKGSQDVPENAEKEQVTDTQQAISGDQTQD